MKPSIVSNRDSSSKLNQTSIELSFEKQETLKYHLKCTKTIIINEIPLKVIRNETCRATFRSNCKVGVRILDYNIICTVSIDKIKSPFTNIL